MDSTSYNPNTESWDQFQARRTDTTQAGAPAPTTVPGAAPGAPADTTGTNAFLKELQSRLLGQTGITASTNPVAPAIDSAITDLQSGLEKSQAGIKAGYAQSLDRQNYDFGRMTTGAMEGAANLGGASQLAILSQLDERNRRAVNDLTLSEQQALASGQYEVASKIADLKLQRAQSQMDFEQKTFSNLFQASQLYMQQQSQQLDQARFTADQTKNIADVALKYGLKITPGETLDSMIGKASVGASQDRQLELQKAKAELAQTYAQTAAANRSNRGSQITEGDRARSAFAAARTALDNSKQYNNGTFHSDAYRKARLDFIVATGDPQAKDIFDANFGKELSPADKTLLKVGL